MAVYVKEHDGGFAAPALQYFFHRGIKMAENEEKIEMSEELAREDLEQWADANEIDLFVSGPNGEKVLDAGTAKLIKAIQKGRLVLTADNEFEYTISEKSPAGYAGTKLLIKAPGGAAFMAMDKFKDQEGYHKTAAYLSAITGQDVAFFSKINHVDVKVLNSTASFFMVG